MGRNLAILVLAFIFTITGCFGDSQATTPSSTTPSAITTPSAVVAPPTEAHLHSDTCREGTCPSIVITTLQDGVYNLTSNNYNDLSFYATSSGTKILNKYGAALSVKWNGKIDAPLFDKSTDARTQRWVVVKFNNGYAFRNVQTSGWLTSSGIMSVTPAELNIVKTTKPLKVREFRYYEMTDPLWATMKFGASTMGGKGTAAGCGPTSMTMVIHMWGNKDATPADMCNLANANKLAIVDPPKMKIKQMFDLTSAQYGFKYAQISKNEVVAELTAGKSVFMVTATNPKIKYTLGRQHCLVLRTVLPDGRILVTDPLTDHSKHTWASSEFNPGGLTSTYIAPFDAVTAAATQFYSVWR